MKLLFLDIDGVMTSDSLNEEIGDGRRIYPFSTSCVVALNEILKLNRVRIVLTSSWRTVFNPEMQRQIFKENGVSQPPSDETVELGFENRSAEIKEYLSGRNVDGFVILDDMEIEGFEGHFLKIDPKFGLMSSHVQQVGNMLKKAVETQ